MVLISGNKTDLLESKNVALIILSCSHSILTIYLAKGSSISPLIPTYQKKAW